MLEAKALGRKYVWGLSIDEHLITPARSQYLSIKYTKPVDSLSMHGYTISVSFVHHLEVKLDIVLQKY